MNMTEKISNAEDLLSSPSEQINLCLNDAFTGSQQSLEKAFGLILGMIENQEIEKRKLIIAQETAQKENQASIESLKKQFKDSCDSMRGDFMRDQQKLASEYNESINKITKERDELIAITDKLNSAQELAKMTIEELQQEIKVMAYNLQGYDDTEIGGSQNTNNSEPTNGEIKSTTPEIEELQDNPSEGVSEIENESTSETENEGTSLGTTNENTSVSFNSAGKSQSEYSKSETTTEEEEPPLEEVAKRPVESLRNKIKSVRKASIVNVSKKKLEMQDTLAVRLDRIEEEREVLKAEVAKLRAGLTGKDQTPERQSILQGEIDGIDKRVSTVERFLEGFGVKKGGQKIKDQTYDNIQCGERDDDHRREKLLENSATTGGNDQYLLKDEGDCKAEKEKIIQYECNDLQIEEESPKYSTNITGSTKGSTQRKKTITNSIVPQNYGSTFDKNQRLILYLTDQEKRFKSDVSDISNRLDRLEKDSRTRVEMKSLGEYVTSNTNENLSNDVAIAAEKVHIEHLSEKLNELRSTVMQLSENINQKVSYAVLNNKIQTITNKNIEKCASNTSNKDEGNLDICELKLTFDQEIQYLRSHKIDKKDLEIKLADFKEIVSNYLEDSLSDHLSEMNESIVQMKLELKAFKVCLQDLESGRDFNKESNISNGSQEDMDLDARIKIATDAVESSLQEVISSRLENLKKVEEELENLTSKLAEKPDQNQINKMLYDLEKAVFHRVGGDETFQRIFESMKTEMNQRMTRAEVLSLVKHLFHGAKEDIQNNSDSLMVGRRPYRCLGCNQLFPSGVNSRLAPKISHNALPSSGGLTPSVASYTRNDNHNFQRIPRALKPLNMSHYRGRRPRTTSERINRRSSSLDIRRANRNRSR